MAKRPLNTPNCVKARYDRLEEVVNNNRVTNVAYFGYDVLNMAFHEPFANACRRVARFCGRVLSNAESIYDSIHAQANTIGNITTRSEVTPPSSELH